MPYNKLPVRLVILSAAISFAIAVGVGTPPSLQPHQEVVGQLVDATATRWEALSGAAIGVLSAYLARRKIADRESPNRGGDLSLPRPTEEHKSRIAIPRSTVVEPGESTNRETWGRLSATGEAGDTASGSEDTESDASSEPDDRSHDIVDPLDINTIEEDPPVETNTQEEVSQDETGDPNAEPAEMDIDTDDHRFGWVTETDVEMVDVGGLDGVKEELRRDIVKPMRENPEKAEEFDIPLPNVLLYGLPGTGKTFVAKALATELGFPFVILSGSDITSKWINESAERIGGLFEETGAVAEKTGGAVVFLDELDAVLPERQSDLHGEDRKVVNEFLSRLQESARERVLFVGATNKRGDLDDAATRNGRIDKEIFVGEPDYEARVEIFEAQLDGRPHALDERDIEELAERTSGVVAADIEFLVNQAARNAAYGRDAERIEVNDIELQLD